ncbi:LysE family translocator [Paludibacterium purpuratum]|uniref:Threonine/homoserine/homoserine lactone efflux protein n=1 Tax=Paludibacterium purpuratum TaxID=1144873 RepID=A0A4R7BCS2_9NEIS|nr:LysE family translocator [Paludibacterium purpuratum]TDR82761.1 threonine/homoserine/homoserine lactone efflux protein [Paludibacterium purpuratum]
MLLHFILATALITLLPGPSLVLIVMQSMRHGVAGSLLAITGVVLADALLLLVVVGGLGALFAASTAAFALLKWLGIGWLMYLGVGQIRSAADTVSAEAVAPSRAFWQGLTTTLLNPKIVGFLLVYFPQFLQRNQPILPQMAQLAPLFLATVWLVFALCALLARALRQLPGAERGQPWLQWVAGMSLIGCALASINL